MAGTQSRYEWQFKQRLTSGGLNSQTAYLARNTSEAMRAFTGFDLESTLQTGVIRGLTVSVVGGTMRISVAPGIGQFYDAAVSEPDSKTKWMELAAAVEATITAADPARPRWEVVEIQPAVVNGVAEIIDFYNPNDNTFSPAVVSVQKLSVAAIQVRAGTPGANPKLLAGVAGWVPLAYVYVGAAVIALNADRVMHCRPLLTPRRGVYRNEDPTSVFSPYTEGGSISGGGWEIEADGFDGLLAAAMNGTFPNGGLPFSIPGNSNIGLVAGNYEGGGLPAGDTLVHAYVAPPPYPSGYDASLGPREIYLKDVTTPNCLGTMPAGSRNCIVLTSRSGPQLTGPLGLRGNPNVNSDTFTDDLWGAFTRQRSTMVYIGGAYHAIGIPGLVTQRVVGSQVSPKRKTGFRFDADLPIAVPIVYNMWASIVGDDSMELPTTARRMTIAGVFNLLTTGTMYLVLEDSDTGAGGDGLLNISVTNVTGVTNDVGLAHRVLVSNAGALQLNEGLVTAIAGGGARFYLREYTDMILAMR